MRHLTCLLALLSALFAVALPARAYSFEESLTREIHVLTEPDWGEAEIILRFPLPMAFAEALLAQQPGQPIEAPFLISEMVEGVPFHHIDQGAYEDNYSGFVDFLLKDYVFTVNGVAVEPELGVLSLVVTRDSVGPFPGLAESIALLSICTAFPGAEHITDLEIAFQLYLPESMPSDRIGIEVTAPKVPAPAGVHFDTVVTDHRGSSPVVLTHAGFVPPPINLPGGGESAAKWFISLGISNVFDGLDTVLFILCLTMAALRLKVLIWSVAGFALAQSAALAAGGTGLLPRGAGVVPTVELGVALSIVVMAGVALWRLYRAGEGAQKGVWLVICLGLLHGTALSFVLAPMLPGAEGAALALPLASFTLGVELGQVLIVVMVWVALALVLRIAPPLWRPLRVLLAAAAASLALFMVIERAQSALDTVFPAPTRTNLSVSPTG